MKRKSDRLTIYFLGYLYAFVMAYLASSIVYKEISILMIILISAASYLFINLVLTFRIPRIILAAILMISALTTGILYLTQNARYINNVAGNIAELCNKIYFSEVTDTPELRSAAIILIVFGSLLAASIVFLLFNKYFRFYLMTGIVIAIQISAWFITGIESKIILAAICLLTVIAYFRHVYEKKLKCGLITDHKVSGSLMMFTIPAAIIPIILIMMIPKNDLPIQWPWLDQKIMKAIQYIEQRFSYSNIEFFSLSTTGFNGFSERLGGPVRPSNTIVMDVTGEKRTYLRGAAYTWYENNMWAQIRNDKLNVISQRENELELEEMRQGWLFIPAKDLFPDANRDDAELLRNLESGRINSLLFPTYTINVSYRNMTTRSMFIPLLTVMPITDSSGAVMPVNENIHGIVIAKDKLSTGSKYTVDYVQPMYGEPILKKALTFSRNTLYRDALTELYKKRNALIQSDPGLVYNKPSVISVTGSQNTIVYSQTQPDTVSDDIIPDPKPENSVALSSIDSKIQSVERLYTLSGMVEKDYTRVSNTIPERVKTLALDITKNCMNDYEKVIAISDFIKKNYKYTLNASRIPQGEDFVDWFLFEDKEGYCTYFATAMTIMLRYNDIPARYVEGYVMPEEHDENDVYTISNRYAHAWVEVYFQGFGWLTFESTPVYSDVMDYRTRSEDFPVIDGTQMPDLEELMRRYGNRYDIPGYTPDINAGASGLDLSGYIKYIPLAVAGLLILMVLINSAAALFSSLFLLRLKSKKKVIRYFEIMLRWLENDGYIIKPGESAIEFGKRIDRYFVFDNNNFSDTTEIFTKVRYGDMDVTAEETAILRHIAKQLRKSILKEFGIRRYMPLRRIILGI